MFWHVVLTLRNRVIEQVGFLEPRELRRLVLNLVRIQCRFCGD